MLNAIFRYSPFFGGGGGGGITRAGILRSSGVGDGLGFGDGVGLGVGFGDGFFAILSSHIIEGKDEKKHNSGNES